MFFEKGELHSTLDQDKKPEPSKLNGWSIEPREKTRIIKKVERVFNLLAKGGASKRGSSAKGFVSCQG
jgi:hypothetical protein